MGGMALVINVMENAVVSRCSLIQISAQNVMSVLLSVRAQQNVINVKVDFALTVLSALPTITRRQIPVMVLKMVIVLTVKMGRHAQVENAYVALHFKDDFAKIQRECVPAQVVQVMRIWMGGSNVTAVQNRKATAEDLVSCLVSKNQKKRH